MNTNKASLSDGATEPTTQTPGAGSTGQGTSQPSSTARQTGSNQIKAISDLLSGASDEPEEATRDDSAEAAPIEGDGGQAERGEDAGHGSDTVDSAVGDGGSDSPLSLKDVAAKLDIEPEAIYDMQITTRDGETLSISELKDMHTGRADREAEIAEKAEALKVREGGLVSDVQALGVLSAMQAIPQALQAQANQHLNAMAEREYSAFVALNPDLQTDSGRIAFDDSIEGWFKSYGLTSAQFPIRTVGMYRLIKDALDDRAELKRIRTPKAKTAPTSVKRNRTPGKAPPAAPKSTSRRGEIEAIAGILKG